MEIAIQAHQPVGQVTFLLNNSFKRGFSSAILILFEISLTVLGGVGLSQLLCVNWLLAYHDVSSDAVSADPQGGEISTCLWVAFCSLTEAASGCEAFPSPQVSHS